MKCRKCRAEIPDESKFCLHCGTRQADGRKPKQRGNGQGSVYKLPNGKWKAIKVKTYSDAQGKTHRKAISCSRYATKKDAVAGLATLGNRRSTARKSTLSAVYQAWLPTHKASKSTLDCYRSAYKYLEDLYHEGLCDITVDDLQEAIDECPRGKRTRQNMKTLIGLLYKYAIPRNLATLNMGNYLTVRSEDIVYKEGLPADALARIMEKVGKIPGADYVACQCYLGFRPSELLALDAKDYNRKERAFVGGAKTDAGRDRTVTISPKIQPIINRLLKDKLSGPVFCSENGSAMDIKAYRTLFYDVLERCGIDNPVEEFNGVERHKYTPHSCRHTFATLMKRVDGSDKDKLELIGHTSTEMLRHYQDIDFADLRRITDAI